MLYDRLGRYVIAAGGVGIIAAVLGIFVFIGKETFPLFTRTTIEPVQQLQLAEDALVVGVDPYREVLATVQRHSVQFLRRGDGQLLAEVDPGLEGADIRAADRSPGDGRLALGMSDGRVLTGLIQYDLTYEDGRRHVTPRLKMDDAPLLATTATPAAVVYRHDGDRRAAGAVLTGAGDLILVMKERRRSLLGSARMTTTTHPIDLQGNQVTSLAMDGAIRRLAVGCANGTILLYDLSEGGEPPLKERFLAAEDASVTALAYLLGDQSLVVGDSQGRVSTWFFAGSEGDRRMRRIHELAPHPAAIVYIEPSERDKQFVTGAADGSVALHHATSEQTFVHLDAPGVVTALAFAPKADALVVIRDGVNLTLVDVDNPHPEINLTTLLGKVWYEGYDEPEYVWQSTGGTDEFEPKLSLVPLAFGTLKGTFYALLFALPIAVLAAIYTAEFAPPAIRNTVKPTVEIMASLPSVILGFLAGLWLAPLLQHYVVGTALLLLAVPLIVLIASWGWTLVPREVSRHLPAQSETVLIGLVTLASACGALMLGPVFEGVLFEGGFARWLTDDSSLRYDQRNSMVIGFAMGFAVIPLIFTICEDALSSVPANLRAGSLALGASRWQTAVRVVLPMALPGVFSAAMIGFGRAIGETMIVLMATGNTPIMEWNIFTGMRTISANIAVELPEAPHQGTLYRVLFLSGLVLFVVTFGVNTIAETVRQRLREKFKRV